MAIPKKVLSVQNLEFFATLQGINPARKRDEIRKLLSSLRLEEKTDTPARKLSRGMQQKLALAAALVRVYDFIVILKRLLHTIYYTILLPQLDRYLLEGKKLFRPLNTSRLFLSFRKRSSQGVKFTPWPVARSAGSV